MGTIQSTSSKAPMTVDDSTVEFGNRGATSSARRRLRRWCSRGCVPISERRRPRPGQSP
jgi:hypothetical protein